MTNQVGNILSKDR